jgi:hypothetical protein
LIKQAISEPEALEMNSRHLEQDLQKALEKHTTLAEHCADLEALVRSLENEIEEKKNFFLSNDQANNIMLTSGEFDKSMNNIRSSVPNQSSPKIELASSKVDKKYDSEASLVNIMKRKLLQLGKTYQKKMHKLEEYHCNFEFTHLQENNLEVEELRKELARLEELTVTIDDGQNASRKSDLFVIDEKPSKKTQNNLKDSRGFKSSYVDPNSSADNMYSSGLSDAKPTRNSSKEAKQNLARPQSGAIRKHGVMPKSSQKSSQLGLPVDMYRPRQSSNHSMSNSTHRSTVTAPHFNLAQLEFLKNHAVIENYRYQNNILSKELAQISDENTSLLKILDQQRNAAVLNDSRLQTLKRELENKKEIMKYFESALVRGVQTDRRSSVKPEQKFATKSPNNKLPTMMDPNEFEIKKGYSKKREGERTEGLPNDSQ